MQAALTRAELLHAPSYTALASTMTSMVRRFDDACKDPNVLDTTSTHLFRFSAQKRGNKGPKSTEFKPRLFDVYKNHRNKEQKPHYLLKYMESTEPYTCRGICSITDTEFARIYACMDKNCSDPMDLTVTSASLSSTGPSSILKIKDIKKELITPHGREEITAHRLTQNGLTQNGILKTEGATNEIQFPYTPEEINTLNPPPGELGKMLHKFMVKVFCNFQITNPNDWKFKINTNITKPNSIEWTATEEEGVDRHGGREFTTYYNFHFIVGGGGSVKYDVYTSKTLNAHNLFLEERVMTGILDPVWSRLYLDDQTRLRQMNELEIKKGTAEYEAQRENEKRRTEAMAANRKAITSAIIRIYNERFDKIARGDSYLEEYLYTDYEKRLVTDYTYTNKIERFEIKLLFRGEDPKRVRYGIGDFRDDDSFHFEFKCKIKVTETFSQSPEEEFYMSLNWSLPWNEKDGEPGIDITKAYVSSRWATAPDDAHLTFSDKHVSRLMPLVFSLIV